MKQLGWSVAQIRSNYENIRHWATLAENTHFCLFAGKASFGTFHSLPFSHVDFVMSSIVSKVWKLQW